MNKTVEGLIADYPFYFTVGYSDYPDSGMWKNVIDDLGDQESYNETKNGRAAKGPQRKWAIYIDFQKKTITFFFKSAKNAVKYRLLN